MRAVIIAFLCVLGLSGAALFGITKAKERERERAHEQAVALARAQHQDRINRLTAKVSAYNDLLLQSSHAAEDTRAALDQLQTTVYIAPERIKQEGDRLTPRVKQNNVTLTRNLSQALKVSESLHASPLFQQRYVDGDLAVPAEDIPYVVKDQGADTLRFAVPRPTVAVTTP